MKKWLFFQNWLSNTLIVITNIIFMTLFRLRPDLEFTTNMKINGLVQNLMFWTQMIIALVDYFSWSIVKSSC